MCKYLKICAHIHFIFIVTSITLLQNVLIALSTQLLLYPHNPFHKFSMYKAERSISRCE